MAKTKEIQLEDTLSRLEALACKLEGEEINLEAALAAFEEGVKLTRNAQTVLQAAEQHVQLLIEQDSQLQAEPFSKEDPE